MSDRLLHTKVSKRKPLTHFPKKEDGHNGDVQIVSIKGKGTYLCLKDKGDWKISNRFNPRNKFDTHIFDEITTRKIKSQSNLMMSFGTISGTVGGDSVTLPITRFGDGSNTAILSTLGSQSLSIETGISPSPTIAIKSTGIFNNFGTTNLTQGFQFNNADSGNGTVQIANTAGEAILELSVDAAKDRYIRFKRTPGEGNKVHALGIDQTDSNFKLTYSTSAALSVSDGTTLFSVDNTGVITATAGFTTTGTWTMDTSAGGTTGITQINVGSAFTDSDTTIMSAGAIKEKIEDYGYSTTTGDITGVTLTGDSGGALADNSGSADFTIAGGTNCASAGSGSTITINVDDAFVKNDADDTMAGTLTIDKNLTNTTTATEKGLYIDCDHLGLVASGQTLTAIGLDLDMNCESGDANHALSTVNQTGIDINLLGATDGSQTNTGINITCSGADTNNHIKLSSNATNYSTFTTVANGATTIATVDSDGTAGDLTLDIDGDIELNADGGNISFKDGLASIAALTAGDCRYYYNATNYFKTTVSSAGVASLITVGGTAANADFIVDSGGDIVLDSGTGIFIAKNAGTEFSVANSSYAGMLLGYTCVGYDVVPDTYALTTSFVCFQDSGGTEIKVSFITPPSEFVEIEVSLYFTAGSGASDLELSLSDNATYGSNGLFHEIQLENTVCEPARGNSGTIVHKWLLKAAELEAIGSNNDIFIAARCDSTSGTPLIGWGGNASGEFTNLYLKATALPATIVEGS